MRIPLQKPPLNGLCAIVIMINSRARKRLLRILLIAHATFLKILKNFALGIAPFQYGIFHGPG
jgi:hypothetical protein